MTCIFRYVDYYVKYINPDSKIRQGRLYSRILQEGDGLELILSSTLLKKRPERKQREKH